MARSAAVNPELNEFVTSALLNKNNAYDELKQLMRECRKQVDDEPDSEEAVLQLSTLVASLAANVSAINERRHEALVSEILSIKLWGISPLVLSAVLEFTRNLVVANSAFTRTCLQLVVYNFTPPPGQANPEDPSLDPHGPWRPSEQATAIQQTLLSLLNRIMSLVPTAATNMLPLIVAQMPHKLRDRNTQCLYLLALFRIAEDRAGTSIKEALLTAAVEHLLSLDIEIKWEDIVDVPTGEEEEEEEDEEPAEDVFQLEEMTNELDINAAPEEVARRQAMLALRQEAACERGGWEGAAAGNSSNAHQEPQASTRPPVDEMANKMDSMMELAFEHLERRIAAGDLRQLWGTLLSAFERTILNTHRSKFTQFLLFYTCIRNPGQCASGLIRLLLTRLRDTRQPQVTRAACAAYLASFLARAAFLPEALVVKTLQELAAFCIHYCKSQGSCGAADNIAVVPNDSLQDAMPFAGLGGHTGECQTQRHQVLYAAVQAILYILCYHMRPLVGEAQHQAGVQHGAGGTASSGHATPGPNGRPTGAGEKRELGETVTALVRGPVWQVLNHQRLKPLGVCLPSVAAEFVHQAASLGIIDCRQLLSQVEPSNRAQRPLEMFFPFDPYLLRRSSRFLQLKQSYVRWRHGHAQAATCSGAEAGDSEEEAEAEDGAAGAPPDSEGGHEVAVSSSSEGEELVSDEDEDVAGQSLSSDAVLHDPTHRLHGGGPGSKHANPRSVVGVSGAHQVHHAPLGRGHGTPGVLGTSYMSYASVDTASHGDGNMSPYGTSPLDGGMLVQNPLGASPGVVPMSLGTPETLFMSQVPMRIGRK